MQLPLFAAVNMGKTDDIEAKLKQPLYSCERAIADQPEIGLFLRKRLSHA